jgi:hypothetical protein
VFLRSLCQFDELMAEDHLLRRLKVLQPGDASTADAYQASRRAGTLLLAEPFRSLAAADSGRRTRSEQKVDPRPA